LRIILWVLKTQELSEQSAISVLDVITIAICAVICGADSWVAIETYGQAKQEWLKRFLELPKDGDYIIALKKNQKTLYESVELLFKEAISKPNKGENASDYSTRELGHGREEIRNYLMLADVSHRIDPDNKWNKLNSIGMVESVRTENGKTTVETRYYISSLNLDAKKFGESVRSHWGIENSLHWILDVALNEDDCRIRKDNAPQNFAVLRHIAVNLLGQETSKKLGIKNKQFLAAIDDNYLAKVLELSC
jgi:predicted transposase YbfD/YdcC